ncbi:DUF3617 family protein [uncultured Sphingosinicella sp.]|uniref:DUF3617 family protein n=1 Tax=uncultured Sphingosinicella sp. TaxID=478748 RepID=UPI0030DBB1D0|tara:strand:+ start:6128 stop:6604 length:477 start_codon:yes stop_codon:yes gene_type:complete
MKRVLAGACIALVAASAAAAPKSKSTATKAPTSTNALWVTTGSIVSVSGAGLTAEQIETIKQQKLSNTTCMARSPKPADIQTAIGNTFGSCTFSKFGLAKTTIRATMKCDGAYGPMDADFVGSRGSTSYSGTNNAVFPNTGGNVYVKSVISGKISGNC